MSSALSALDEAPIWLNSDPLTAAELRGRVVLVDFWTYSCVNWLRTLPYVRAWHERYREHGLVVVGVHAPEFGFEHDLANVRRAVDDLDVGYPVVIDNDFTDLARLRQPLLAGALPARRRRPRPVPRISARRPTRSPSGRSSSSSAWTRSSSDVAADGLAQAADWDALRSPETYLGRARGERRTDARTLALNQWALTGRVGAGRGGRGARSGRWSITYRFQARDVNLVLAPSGGPGRASPCRLDGGPPGDAHGLDVDASGAGTLSEPRMYQLVRQQASRAERTFEVTFDGPGVRAYVFTFG